MRCWHKDIVKSLPDLQLKSQWRELVLMAKDIYEKGTTNHLLINRIMDYDINHFNAYCRIVMLAMIGRGISVTPQSVEKLYKYVGFIDKWGLPVLEDEIFKDWHNKEYLRVCMANLYEKHVFGVGKSRISDAEWETLLRGYKEITLVKR